MNNFFKHTTSQFRSNRDTTFNVRSTKYHSNSQVGCRYNHVCIIIYIFYNTICSFNFQYYLDNLNAKSFRVAVSRLRVSSHRLEVEKGRCKTPPVPYNNRLCNTCICQVLDDEFHFLFECQLLQGKIHYTLLLYTSQHEQIVTAIVKRK